MIRVILLTLIVVCFLALLCLSFYQLGKTSVLKKQRKKQLNSKDIDSILVQLPNREEYEELELKLLDLKRER